MKQAAAPQSEWASSNALGLFAFGLNTVLLQIHNLGAMPGTMPLVYGLVWGGLAQVIAGIIAGKRNDLFHLTAFTSYGAFWLTLVALIVMAKLGWIDKSSNAGMICYLVIWGIFTFLMFIGTLKISRAWIGSRPAPKARSALIPKASQILTAVRKLVSLICPVSI